MKELKEDKVQTKGILGKNKMTYSVLETKEIKGDKEDSQFSGFSSRKVIGIITKRKK